MDERLKKLILTMISIIIIILGITTLPQTGLALDTTVSGTVSMPTDEVAPAGGIRGYVAVRVEYDTDGNSYSERSGQFIILAGQSTADYTVTVPADTSITGYRVSYNLNKYDGYVEKGWYSTGGTTNYRLSATVLNEGILTGIDLTLVKGNTIFGTVFLPEDDVAPAGGLSLYVFVSANTSEGYYESIKILEGERSASFQETVPVDNAITGYSVRYYISNSNNNRYVESGYYSTGGVTSSLNTATLVNVNGGNVSGINLTILKGNIVSGTISLPVGEQAPTGGIRGNIIIESQNRENRYSKSYTIPEGSNSASYTITVPVDPSIAGWRAGYSIYSNYNTGYVQYGYYSTEGTTKFSLATLLDLNAGDVSDINLTLRSGNTISGTISLPADRTAPAGGIEGYVYIPQNNEGNSYGTNFTIPAGEGSAGYSITVPVDNTIDGYGVRYRLQNYYEGYVDSGSYATLVNVNDGNAAGIDLHILTGHLVSGTISLPEGATAPAGGIKGEIELEAQTGIREYYTNFTINQDENSASYRLTVPVDNSIAAYRVKYWLQNDYEGYVGNGEYSTLINVNAGNVTGINLNIVTGHLVSGTISLPEGVNAPAGGINGNVSIRPPNSNLGYYKNFMINEGENSTSYQLTVPVDNSIAGYIARYWLKNDYEGYVGSGYYSDLVNVNEGNTAGVNLRILTGNTISGIISLPAGVTAPAGGIKGEICCRGQSGYGHYSDFVMAADASSASYKITVPVDPAIAGYRVGYWFGGSGYVSNGYYSVGGTTNYSSATLVNVNDGNKTGINLMLITGHTISGTVSLPGGATAPVGGITLAVTAEPENGGDCYHSSTTISAEASSAPYTLTVPADGSINNCRIGYTFYYSGYKTTQYLGNGYYSTGGTSNYNSAALVNVSGGNVADINLQLLTAANLTDDYGNTMGTAHEISAGSIPVLIENAGDVDWFKLNCSSTGVYIIETRSNIDTYGYLYNAAGTELAKNDDDGADANFLITTYLQADQQYYIKTRHFANETGSYNLWIHPGNAASASLSLNKTAATMIAGQTEQLTVTFIPANPPDSRVTWTIFSQSGSNIVSVSAAGLVTAINPGTAVIRVTSDADPTKYADCNITVTAPQNSAISPTTGSFDKNPAQQKDLIITITFNGNTLSSISNGTKTLLLDTDYSINNNNVTINKNYLANLGTNTIGLTFNFSAGAPQTLTIIVNDSSIDNCFIATAAFGSKFTWPVALLRHFRDQYLLTNAWGTAFVNFYYRNSPPIASLIASSPELKIMTRIMLAPIIAGIYLLYHPTVLFLLLSVIIFLMGIWLKSRRHLIME